jgi:uncharacterized repeat protein (TIGR03943 family)
MLSLIGTAATLWLALTGKLELYVHPRYVVFNVCMALIAAVVAIAGFVMRPEHSDEPDGHTGAEPAKPGRLRAAGSLLIITAAVLGLLVIPPSPLTAEAASHRDLNVSGTLSRHQTNDLLPNDPGTFTVRDWASLLRYSPGDKYFTDKTAAVTGFITADPTDPTNVLYVTRFVVSCCTVDAQPVGVPVRHPGWQKEYKTGNWITATGKFAHNPNQNSPNTLIMTDPQITLTAEPQRPYLN